MVDLALGFNIHSYNFLQYLDNNGITIPSMDEPSLCIRHCDNVSKRALRIASLPIHLVPKIIQSSFHVMSGKITYNLFLGR